MSVLLSVSAPVSFSVLLLLDAPHGSLAEIELTRADLPVGTRSHWLWIEERTVTELQAIGTGTPSRKAFDRAVLALDGERAECHRGRHLTGGPEAIAERRIRGDGTGDPS